MKTTLSSKYLSLIPLAALLAGGCENSAGGDYNKTVNMPPQCLEVISAGYSNSIGYGAESNWDWISCKDTDGNVTIYRMNKEDQVWYKTEIKK